MPLRPGWVYAAVWLVLIVAFVPGGRADDESDLLEMVKAYFEAEITGDMARVWEMLAPSSAFRKAYSYPFFVELLKDSRVRLREYTIEKVLEIAENQDKAQLPLVEKIATVQVRVVLSDKSGNRFERTSAFTFLMEHGRWYKG
ncbi:MAG: hypothetical protein LDL33_01855 [Desulfomonile sp.]|nr:hypothetical protein [Desulfomonile sp.]